MKRKDEIIQEIRIEFLSLIRESTTGYFISLEKTYSWLENPDVYTSYSTDENFRRNFRKRYLRNDKFMLDESVDESDREKDYIMRKEKNINIPWFSIEGFKTFCMVVNETKSNYIRKYFIQIEKDYMRVLEQSAEKTKMELTILNQDLIKAKSSIIKLSDTSDKHLEQKLSLEYKLKKVESLEIVLDDQDDFNTVGNNQYKEYLYLREIHMKKIPLYIVKPDIMDIAVKSPAIKIIAVDSDSEDILSMMNQNIVVQKKTKNKKSLKIDTDIHYKKKYNEYNFNNDILMDPHSGEDSPVLFYYLGAYAERVEKNITTHFKIADIFVKDKEHLDEIKNELGNAPNKYGKRWIYKTTYTNINNIALGISNNRLRDILKNN